MEEAIEHEFDTVLVKQEFRSVCLYDNSFQISNFWIAMPGPEDFTSLRLQQNSPGQTLSAVSLKLLLLSPAKTDLLVPERARGKAHSSAGNSRETSV
ncbi:MAG: hypothetical protein LRY53_00995 [Burkholderiaceae bacterium]|nr:hypothetical protein [Burkholderiaceae bacterium]